MRAEVMIEDAPTSRLNSMFGPPKEGFRWLTLNLSGPVAQPEDNFKELFSTAAAAPRIVLRGSPFKPAMSMNSLEKEAILSIALLAAFADHTQDEAERALAEVARFKKQVAEQVQADAAGKGAALPAT